MVDKDAHNMHMHIADISNAVRKLALLNSGRAPPLPSVTTTHTTVQTRSGGFHPHLRPGTRQAPTLRQAAPTQPGSGKHRCHANTGASPGFILCLTDEEVRDAAPGLPCRGSLHPRALKLILVPIRDALVFAQPLAHQPVGLDQHIGPRECLDEEREHSRVAYALDLQERAAHLRGRNGREVGRRVHPVLGELLQRIVLALAAALRQDQLFQRAGVLNDRCWRDLVGAGELHVIEQSVGLLDRNLGTQPRLEQAAELVYGVDAAVGTPALWRPEASAAILHGIDERRQVSVLLAEVAEGLVDVVLDGGERQGLCLLPDQILGGWRLAALGGRTGGLALALRHCNFALRLQPD
eukprot:scaffold58427_cov69-Phaeocystis_antarctica.AAC.8